ncbi:hypothetical protein LWI28_028643 [Acer negundo]|uniref:Uncharacterized protein n=1 Tax=Acer negundo TaxID=4023 RepID=A0AAD5JMJ5_ACENE|nr:hypothetical protein LWI28_028643 [Acer negundo]
MSSAISSHHNSCFTMTIQLHCKSQCMEDEKKKKRNFVTKECSGSNGTQKCSRNRQTGQHINLDLPQDFWDVIESKKGSDVRLPLEVFIKPSLKVFGGIDLFRWEMKKENRSISMYQYVLIRGCNEVRERNILQIGDQVQLWSFRIEHELCLALVKVPKPK